MKVKPSSVLRETDASPMRENPGLLEKQQRRQRQQQQSYVNTSENEVHLHQERDNSRGHNLGYNFWMTDVQKTFFETLMFKYVWFDTMMNVKEKRREKRILRRKFQNQLEGEITYEDWLHCFYHNPPSLGGVALFPILLCGATFLPLLPSSGAPLSPSSVGWCFFASSFFGWCFLGGATFPFSSVGWCRLASLFGWCCVWPSLLLRGAAFLLTLLVVLLSLSSSLGWCRLASFVGCCCVLHSPFAWCCLPSSPFGGAAFSPSSVWVPLGLLRWLVMRCSLSFFVVLPSFPFFFGWGCFLPLFCWKVLPYLLFLWVVFWVGLLFNSLLLGGAAWPPSLSGVALFPLLLRGAAFLPLLPWVGLVSLPSSVGWCCPPSPPLGGDAFPPSSVGWCCLPSPPLGEAAFPLLFSWVVLLGLLRWVVLRYSLSFFAWCCLNKK